MDEPLDEDIAPPEVDGPPSVPVVKRRRSPWLMLVLLLIAVFAGFLILRHRQNPTAAAAKSAPPQPGISISTAVAKEGNIGVYINALGSVAGDNRALFSFSFSRKGAKKALETRQRFAPLREKDFYNAARKAFGVAPASLRNAVVKWL